MGKWLRLFALLLLFDVLALSSCSEDGGGPSPVDTTFSFVDSVVTESIPARLVVSGDVLVASASYSVALFSLSDPARPQYTSDCPQSFSAQILSIAADNGVLYVAVDNPYRKVVAFDVSVPTSPQTLGEITLPSSPLGICVSGSHVFVGYGASADGDVIDFSNPAEPQVVASLGQKFSCCFAREGYLYAASSDGWLYMFDVSTPEAPQLLDYCNTGGQNLDVDVTAGGVVYVAGGVEPGTNNARIVAYSTDELGTEVLSENVPGFSAKSVSTQADFAYMLLRPTTGPDYELRVYSPTPEGPELFFADTLVYANDLIARGGYLYVGARSAGGTGGVILVYRHTF